MLRIVDKRADKSAMIFGVLKIGDCYQDGSGHICIKIGEQKCMYFIDDAAGWALSSECEYEEIIPLEAKLVIGGNVSAHD